MQKIIIEIVFIYKPFLQDITITMFVVFKFLGARRIPSLAGLQKEGLVCSEMVHSCGLLSCLVFGI